MNFFNKTTDLTVYPRRSDAPRSSEKEKSEYLKAFRAKYFKPSH